MNVLPDFHAVVPAAGIGSRMRADRPKQYLEVAGRSILEHTLDRLIDHPSLLTLTVSLAADDPFWPQLTIADDSRVSRANGGAERAESVLNALRQLTDQGADEQAWVLVHDAARPNLARADLDRLLAELRDDSVGGLLAVPSRDTLKRADDHGRVAETLDRSVVWQAHTPQMFRLGMLRTALEGALLSGTVVTDEASAMERAGHAPRLIEGRADNLKVTRPEDLEWLRRAWAGSPSSAQ